MESEQLMLERGEDHRALPFWKTRAFKYGVIVFAMTIVMVLIAFFLLHSTTDTIDKLTKKKEKKAATEQIQPQKENNSYSQTTYTKIDAPRICYEQVWINDNVVTYKLNNGNYAYNPSYLIPRCPRIRTE